MLDIMFLNVGSDTEYAEILCRSVKNTNPKSKTIQVTDVTSTAVNGVDEIIRFDGNSEDMMLFRSQAFSRVQITRPTLFLDTDMIVLQELPDLQGVGLCQREFGIDDLVNPDFKGLEFSEHKWKTFGDVYPILGCTIFSSGPNIWKKVYNVQKKLKPKYWSWYGDQEALRIISERDSSYIKLKESDYACLSEYYKSNWIPRIVHFKGKARKAQMIKVAQDLGFK
jgi:hypothetical protein